MTAPTVDESAPPDAQQFVVPLEDVERALSHLLNKVQAPGEMPARKARMSNLIVYCATEEQANLAAATIPAIVSVHPARVLLLVGEVQGAATGTAEVNVWCQVAGQHRGCSEQVTLRTSGTDANRLPFAVRSLLIGDLPVNLWWANPLPPPLAGPLLYDLSENTQQVVFDSLGWANPHRGVAATAAWLARFERSNQGGRWRVASDLNWRRLKFWRRILTQTFDPGVAMGNLESTTEVLVKHGPHAVTQAWQLIGWLASRLKWQVQNCKVQPGVEIDWHVKYAGGSLLLRIVRLPEGPSAIHQVRVSCKYKGEPRVLNFMDEDGKRLSAVMEGSDVAPRTLSVQRQTLADMLTRQLSDRERDRVFSESMAVAQVFAERILR